jgi:hypothetical protein
MPASRFLYELRDALYNLCGKNDKITIANPRESPFGKFQPLLSLA